jgi:chemotaxis protein MotB
MYRQRRISHDNEEPQLDRWLVSYADYMTLMFALFVVLYSLAIVKEEQYNILSETLGKVFETEAAKGEGVKGEGILLHNDPVDTEHKLYGTALNEEKGPQLVDGDVEVSNIAEKKMGNPLSSLEQELKDALFDLEENGYAKVELKDDWLNIELNSGLLFASGSASPTHSAQLILKEINSIIGPVSNYIRVRGYTDDQPINTEFYSSNWELSVARATTALKILQSLNVDPRRMAIEGYGQYSPFVDNANEQGRKANRKVVIALSKYALDITVGREINKKIAPLSKINPKALEEADHKQIQVIELPTGGIRITTRRDGQSKMDAAQTDKNNTGRKR